MKLIVGLGNPGRLYADSRHNIGFNVVKALTKFYKVTLKKDRGTLSLSVKLKAENHSLVLAMPLTFMNLSGLAAGRLMKKYKVSLDDLLVVYDDLDLKLGVIKIKAAGSSGGHRGIQSIIDSLGSGDFSRLRIGVGRPEGETDAAEYVLSPFAKNQNYEVKRSIGEAGACCRAWITQGIAKTMNIFNPAPFIYSKSSKIYSL